MACCSIGEVRGVIQVVKIVLKEFRIHPEVRFRMRSLHLYRMSKDGVYQSSVPSFCFWEMSSSKWPDPIQIWEVE